MCSGLIFNPQVTVISLRSLGSTRRAYVAKTISKSNAVKFEGQTSVLYERHILTEAVKARRNDIVHLAAAFQDDTNLILLLEYLPAGDLGLLLEQHKQLPEDWVKFWTAQTFQALFWLHGLGYVHRDIKPANILLTMTGHVNLADFGSVAPLSSGQSRMVIKRYCQMPVGTVDYVRLIAPDILLAHESTVKGESFQPEYDGEGLYGASIDFWSCGVMLYELLSGELPFFAESIPETYEKILNHEEHLKFGTFHTWTSESQDIIRRWGPTTLRKNPIIGAEDHLCRLLTAASSRLGRQGDREIRCHSFFSNLRWDNLQKGPAPFKPSLRHLSPDKTNHESITKVFDFSALFSSPGLSILRPEEGANEIDADLHWAGFTHLPEMNEFEPRPDDVTQSQLLPSVKPGQGTPTAYPQTPARSSSTPFGRSSSHGRNQRSALALKEVITYGILKTAKKASAGTTVLQNASESLCQDRSQNKLIGLEIRQKKLVDDIDGIERRYQSLFRMSSPHTYTS